ncbi:MAG: glycosyltransferase family 9 protein [Deltaproteobacteria bacterium]|nr:glycosyltransferase family 9 protein [Deltaproteobacteria bacterium]
MTHSSEPARTLVVSLQGIGNNLLALPLASALARIDGRPVVMLTHSPRVKDVLRLRPEVGDVIAVGDAWYRGNIGGIRLIRELRARRFARAVLAHPAGSRAAALVALSGIAERIAIVSPRMSWGARFLTHGRSYVQGMHDLEHNESLAEMCEAHIDFDRDWPPLRPEQGDVEGARAFLASRGFDPSARYVGLHTGCDGEFPEKRWPEKSFAALARALHNLTGRAAVVFDGPAEAGSGLRVAHFAGSPVLAMNGWGGMAQALGMLAFCDVFAANDSGLMNLAAAAGVPCVAIFGPSEVARTRPWGARHRVIRADRACVPCFHLGPWAGCIHPNRPCLEDVSVEVVLRAVRDLLPK